MWVSLPRPKPGTPLFVAGSKPGLAPQLLPRTLPSGAADTLPRNERCRNIGAMLEFFFVLNLVFLSRYMQSEGLWQRQHAAAPRKQETAAFFPPQVYPFPAPEPACAVIVGVSQRLLLPISARKHYRIQRKRVKQLHHPHSHARVLAPPCYNGTVPAPVLNSVT